MPLTLDDLSTSPDHYLHSFEGDTAVFVPMDRAAYHRSIFLDQRISAAGPGAMRMPVSALSGLPQGQPISWIFHIAHGGSTLLARALDRIGGNLVLREPLSLRQTAILPDPQRLAAVLAMLGKRYRPDLPTIVKANVPVNFILPQIAAADVRARAIFLHMPLRDYLLAILRSPDHRNWVRNVTTQLAGYLGDLSALSDAERAAALWLAQMRVFENAMSLMPHAVSLESERFFGDPANTVAEAAAHLGVELPDGELGRIVAGPLFATHSKRPDVPFNNTDRLARRAALAAQMAEELEVGRLWIGRAGAAVELECPLIRLGSVD